MALYFLDSSALVKRYINEPGTAWIQDLFLPANNHRIAAALISGAEVVAAVVRRQRSGAISGPDTGRMIQQFRADFFADIAIIEVSPGLIQNAMSLAERHALRGYDAVQLAAAMAFHGVAATAGLTATLVCADHELNAAASAEGLTVEDPNNRP